MLSWNQYKKKGTNQAVRNLEEDAKTKHNNKTKPNCNPHITGQDINLWKLMQVQAKFMKLTWSSACRGGGRGNFTSTKKLLAEVKEMNNLFASAVAKGKKKSKDKAKE